MNESIVEEAALTWFGELGYAIGHGPHLAPGEPAAERESFGDVVLEERLRQAIRRLNPAIPEEAREEAFRKVLRVGTPSLTQTNRAFHRMLRDGLASFSDATTFSARRRSRLRAGSGCANCSRWPVAGWSSRPSRSFSLRKARRCPR